MPTESLQLAVISGSVRAGRFGPVVAQWFVDLARQHGGFAVDHVDPADTPLPDELPAAVEELVATEARPPAMAALADRLHDADAFVVVTPEYNHSFPASLKHLIDWHPTPWQAKPVGFVSYGGIGGGLRAVEQLRLVFAELQAVTVRDTVSFHDFWTRFDFDGRLRDPAGATQAAKAMLDQLGWYGAVLRDGRHDGSYGQPAH